MVVIIAASRPVSRVRSPGGFLGCDARIRRLQLPRSPRWERQDPFKAACTTDPNTARMKQIAESLTDIVGGSLNGR